MESNGKSNNHWKCQNHTAPNRGGWTLFHPPPTREGTLALVLALKEKGKLVRCTNWLISQNYCSFWRTPPPLKNRRGHLLNQRANSNFFNYLVKTLIVTHFFKLDRTSYISHEQTQFFNKRIYNINR